MGELHLYNTLTRAKEAFVPIDPANVRMYVCGPTVYDYAHIGNARPAIVFDVLFRLLRHLYGPQHVTYVRNITDVDDKINARARRDFPDLPLNEAIARVTSKTAEQYHKDVVALGCLPPTVEPRATDHIPGMVAMIQQLLDRGHAYVATGGEGREVLFDVVAMPDYGKLSRRRLDEQQAGARVAVEAHKKNPADFVLWKESSADEPGWEGRFTFGGETLSIHGRPGWHIECSVMSAAHLGEVFDIHGGGLDLIFPHHENEIAQSRCAHGNDVMANVWMHNGFVQVEGRKMSKSEGNFVTIHDLLHTDKFGGRKWAGEVLRLAMLMTHYREPIDFTTERLWLVENKLTEIATTIAGMSVGEREQSRFPANAPSDDLVYCLADDLRTDALESYFERMLQQCRGRFGGYWAARAVTQLADDIAFLGLDLRDWVSRNAQVRGFVVFDEGEVDDAITRRLALIAEKNFAEADKIRDELAAQGIQLMDYKDPETGERRTKWEVKR